MKHQETMLNTLIPKIFLLKMNRFKIISATESR